MTEKTLPPSKSADSSRAARGLKDGPPIDPNSQTLVNFPPVVPAGTSPSTVAHGQGETIQAPPPPEPPPVPPEAVHTPDPPAPPNAPPGPGVAATMEFVRPNPSDLTVSGAPDLTLGGNEAVKDASLHFDKVAEPGTKSGSTPGPLPPVQDPGTREYRLADFVRDNPEATIGGHDNATRAFHLAAFTAPTHDATLGGHDAVTQQFHQDALAAAPKAVATGASFGHYELIEPIAKGGMGIVYKARQRTLNRIVAIKMILAGQFADQSDIDRFYAEAEAAAALSHPNIVAIHEIGQVQGQHFFSMDYIEGKSLSGLIQENTVTPRRAAEFVRTIAETMQFAHDSGVVHRDLKPANILLDKRQRPLITDFGLAKQVSNTSQLTMAGSVVGTPSYMPPEQAAGKIDEVGPWSDLYSLGAILYELLTGRPPFRAATPFETVRQVLEQEPASPRLLNPALPRDLETIALKCLQKERSRRYDSAQELADELGRYLRGEPIHARPISQIHRFWRLCKRNPATSMAIAAAALFFVAASVVSTAAYFKTSAALAKSDQSLEEAMQAVDDLFTIVSENKLINQPGMQTLRQDLLNKTLSYYERFIKQRAGDARVEKRLAASQFRVGKIALLLGSLDDSIEPFTTARAAQERLVARKPDDQDHLKALGDTLTQLGQVWVRKKDYDAASRDFAEAVKTRERLAVAYPTNDEYQRGLANAHMNAGLLAFNLAKMNPEDKQFQDRIQDAGRQFEDAQRIRNKILSGELKDAKLRRAVARDLGMGYFNFGVWSEYDQNTLQAIEHYKKGAGVFEELLQSDPSDLEIQGLLPTCRRLAGSLLKNSGQTKEAREWNQQALERMVTLAKENPDVPLYHEQQAALLLDLYELEKQEKNDTEARTALEGARKIYAPLAQKFPEVPEYQRDLAVTLQMLAKEKFAAGEESSAGDDLQEAIRLFTALVEQFPDEVEFKTRRDEAEATVLAKPPE
jgi:eukaryotic-like serine/threonine-protein kinase